MADRDGLGDLPLFDTEVRPVREFVAQEQRQEDDYQYITRMYSALARQILDLIEDICDQMEYEGSPMYDRYPDKVTMGRMAAGICGHYCCQKDRVDRKWLRPMVEIMLCNEMNCRREKRCRHYRSKSC